MSYEQPKVFDQIDRCEQIKAAQGAAILKHAKPGPGTAFETAWAFAPPKSIGEAIALTQASYADRHTALAYKAQEAASEAQRLNLTQQLLGRIEQIAAPGSSATMGRRKAIDLGCGYGRDTALLRRGGFEAIGMDTSAAMLELATAIYGHPDWWTQADVFTLQRPPQDSWLDLIWCANLLMHIPRACIGDLFSRWRSWLRPGGTLVIMAKQGKGEHFDPRLSTAAGADSGQPLMRLMVSYQLREVLAAASGFQPVHIHTGQRSSVATADCQPNERWMTLILQRS